MQKIKNLPTKKSYTRIALILIAIAVVIVGLLEVTNTTHVFHKAKLTVSTINSTHPSSTTAHSSSKSPAQPNVSSPPSNQIDKNTNLAAPTSSSGTGPVTPTGTFISNHQPSLGAQPNRAQENSVCVTTPGATCYIEFTQGSAINKLQAETTDINGAAYWTWDVSKDAGFTTGTWQVAAIATLNGKTATGTDTMEVQP